MNGDSLGKKIIVIGGNGSGKTRPDMADNCTEKFSPDFYLDVFLFNHKHRNDYHRMLASCKDKNVVIFKNRREVNEYLTQI